MKIPIAASAAILGIALSTYCVAQAMLSETRRWTSSAVANTLDGDVLLWLALWLPLGVGSSLAAVVLFILVRRLYAAQRISEIRGLALVVLPTCAALWLGFSSLEAGAHRGPRPQGDRRWPRQLFSQDQWAELEARWSANDLRGRTIPHDEELLDRWTLVGLSVADISRLLRSRIDLSSPRQSYVQTTTVGWRMCCPDNIRPSEYWALELTFSHYDAVVIREALYQQRPEPPIY